MGPMRNDCDRISTTASAEEPALVSAAARAGGGNEVDGGGHPRISREYARASSCFVLSRGSPREEVSSLEIDPAVYRHGSNDRAEQRLYGMLGAFGRWSCRYGEKEWFFTAYQKCRPDGSLALGYFAYAMAAEKAA